MKIMKKILLFAFITICIIIVPIQSVQAASNKTKNNYKKKVLSKYSYEIPAINSTYVPQGLCRVSYNGKTYRLITSYDHNKKKNSRIYILNSSGKLLRTVYIKNSRGQHVGGIAELGDNIWISSTKKMYMISKKSLFTAKNKGTIKPSIFTNKQIRMNGNFSFCTSYNNVLYIGTFSEEKSSCVYGFKYNNTKKTFSPVSFIRIPSKIQGIAFLNDNEIALSKSYGIYDSTIYRAKLKKMDDKVIKPLVNSTGIKNWYDYKIYSKIIVPAGAEQIYFTGSNNLYILFESGSKYFITKYLGRTVSWSEKRVILYDL